MSPPSPGMGGMHGPAPMHQHAFRQLDEIIARLGRIEARLGIAGPATPSQRPQPPQAWAPPGAPAGERPSASRPQPSSRPEVPEEVRRAMEQRMQEGRHRMEEAQQRMEDAKKKFPDGWNAVKPYLRIVKQPGK